MKKQNKYSILLIKLINDVHLLKVSLFKNMMT